MELKKFLAFIAVMVVPVVCVFSNVITETFDTTTYKDTSSSAPWGYMGLVMLPIGSDSGTDTLSIVGQTTGTYPANGLDIGTNYAYIGGPGLPGVGLYIVDILNPANPVQTASCTISNGSDWRGGMDVKVVGNDCFVATYYTAAGRVTQVDVYDKYNPSIIRYFPVGGGSSFNMCVNNDKLYLGNGHYPPNMIYSLNPAFHANPTLDTTFYVTGPSYPYYISAYGNYVYATATSTTDTLFVYQITPYPMTLVGILPRMWSYIENINGNYLVNCRTDSVVIVDVSRPDSPTIYSYINPGNGKIHLWNNYLFRANGASGVMIYDISDLKNLRIVSSATPGSGISTGEVYAGSGYIYGGCNGTKLSIWKIRHKTSAIATSLKVNNDTATVRAVMLNVTDSKPSGASISYKVSADGGINWEGPVTHNEVWYFTNTGNDLRWKAEMSTTDPFQSPVIYEIKITIPQDIDAPSWDKNVASVITLKEDKNNYSISLSWSSATDPSGGINYDVQRKDGDGSWYLDTNTTVTSYAIDNLSDTASHYVRIRARDVWGNATAWSDTVGEAVSPSWTKTVAMKTSPQSDLNYYIVNLYWDVASDNAGVKYTVRQKIDAGDWAILGITTDTGYTVTNLDTAKKNYFTVEAKDYLGNSSGVSEELTDQTAPVWSGDLQVADVSAKSETRAWVYNAFVNWTAGADNTSEIVMYETARKEGDAGEWKDSATINALGIYYRNLSPGYRHFFRIRARDSAGNGTDWKETAILLAREASADIDENGGILEIEDYDGIKENNIKIEVPKNAVRGKKKIGIVKVASNEYEIDLKTDKGVKVSNVSFGSPISVRLIYDEKTVTDQGWKEDELGVFYYDGLIWIQIASSVNATHNTVEFKVFHLTKFKIMKKNPTDFLFVAPQHVTPNNDGINETIRFNFSGQGMVDENTKIDIYDVNGKKIRTLDAKGSGSVEWDGRDSAGNVAESGVYVYIVKSALGKIYSGSVVVAK